MTIKKVPVRGKGHGWMGSGEPMLPTLGLNTVTMDLWPALACARATLRDKDAFSAKSQLRILANNNQPRVEEREHGNPQAPFPQRDRAPSPSTLSMGVSHLAADTLLSILLHAQKTGEKSFGLCGALFSSRRFPFFWIKNR